MPDKKLAEALLEGLRKENEDPDAVDGGVWDGQKYQQVGQELDDEDWLVPPQQDKPAQEPPTVPPSPFAKSLTQSKHSKKKASRAKPQSSLSPFLKSLIDYRVKVGDYLEGRAPSPASLINDELREVVQWYVDNPEGLAAGDDDYLQVIAEILVMLFGGGSSRAWKSFHDVLPHSYVKQGGPPGPPPRPGLTWNSHTHRWVRAPAGATPAPPAGAPAPIPGGVKPPTARAISTAAYNTAMAKLNAGTPLSAADKHSLSRKLGHMSMGRLQSLHTALGGTHTANASQAAVTAAIKTILAGAAPASPIHAPTPAAPTLAPVPTPAPAAAGLASIYQPGAASNTPLNDQQEVLRIVKDMEAGVAVSSTDKLKLTNIVRGPMTYDEAKAIAGVLGIGINGPTGIFASIDNYIGNYAALTPAPAAPTPAPSGASPSPPPSAALINLPPTLQTAAGKIRALAWAQHDGLITSTIAERDIILVMGTLSTTESHEVVDAFGDSSIRMAADLIKHIVNTNQGHVGSSPPGPPPRTGLVWNPTTHRWILAPAAGAAPAPINVNALGLDAYVTSTLISVQAGNITSAFTLSHMLSRAEMMEALQKLGRPGNANMPPNQLAREIIDALVPPGTTPPPAVAAPAPRSVPKPSSASNLKSTFPFKDETSWETGKAEAGTLNGIEFKPAPPKFWEKVTDVDVGEPPTGTRHTRAGILIVEPDGRIWIAQPTNGFGGRKYTLPGGTIEKGLTDQQNALKETWEETGLQVEITGYVGDFDDANYGSAGQSSRTGRLYIGRRIGGAPWDAKPEPGKIPPSTKNGSTAESEAVTLVTPEKAAQLLNRTDDLAQLIAVNPIPVDAKWTGTGSETLKKLYKALEPRVKEYIRKKRAAGHTYKTGNGELHAVQEMRGFNKPPEVVKKSDFDALMAQGGHIEMLRAVTSAGSMSSHEVAEEFRKGEHFPGHGCFGSGTYCDSNGGSRRNVANTGQYGNEVLRIAIPKTARIIKQSDLEKAAPQPPKDFAGYSGNGGHRNYECWWGVQAALAGYDAIEVDGKSIHHYGYGKGFYVLLNRGIAVVQKENASGHKIP